MNRILLLVVCFLMRRKCFFIAVNEALMLGGMHVHKNGKRKKLTAVVNFPQPGVAGVDE
jgi:hypothetical protein